MSYNLLWQIGIYRIISSCLTISVIIYKTQAAAFFNDVAEQESLHRNSSVTQDVVNRKSHEMPTFMRRKTRSVVRPREWLWHNRVVPYVLDSSLTIEVKRAFEAAVDEIEEASCVRFKRRTNEDDYLSVKSLDGCWSDVGRVGGEQEVSLASNCNSKGIALHEMLHALGFWHEHCRLDRDAHIRVMWDNIEDGMNYNFDKHDWLYNDLLGLPYDYDSIMHYNAYSFSSNGKATLVPLRQTKGDLGQRKGMSPLDARKLNKLYSCDETQGWSKWGEWSPCSSDCFRIRERFCIGSLAKKRCFGDSQQLETCPGICHPAKKFGCWEFNPSRPSIPSLEGKSSLLTPRHMTRINPIRDCADAAAELGYKLFAVTNDSMCLGGPTAHLNYRRDGPSDTCSYIDRGNLDSFYAFSLENDTPADGQWGVWSSWSSCSKSCGSGVRSRERSCNNPEKEDGGRDCEGSSRETEGCNKADCPRWPFG